MSTQCHGCQGWGHLRRDCPTVKGQGKGGEKGKGKGNKEIGTTLADTGNRNGGKEGKA